MGFADIIAVLGRRWYVLVAGIVLVAGLGWVMYVIAPPQYTTRGLVLLLPPVVQSEDGGNPFLNLGGLDIPARVVVASLSSNDEMDLIAKRAPDAEVAVTIEDSTRGPVIAVDVKDPSEATALDTLSFVAGQIPSTLATLQSQIDVPQNVTVRSMPLTMDTTAKRDYSTFIRLLILVVAGGLVLAVAIAFIVDNLTTRRVSARQHRTQPDSGSPVAVKRILPVLRHAHPADPLPASSVNRSDSRISTDSSS